MCYALFMKTYRTAYASDTFRTAPADLRKGFTVKDPVSGRLVKIDAVYPLGVEWFVRFDNGNPGESYAADHFFDVIVSNQPV